MAFQNKYFLVGANFMRPVKFTETADISLTSLLKKFDEVMSPCASECQKAARFV